MKTKSSTLMIVAVILAAAFVGVLGVAVQNAEATGDDGDKQFNFCPQANVGSGGVAQNIGSGSSDASNTQTNKCVNA
jgi:hypothetical protein